MQVLFSKEKINKILTKSDIVKVIGSKIQVFQSGGNYKAQCPFHEEKTPSFFINREKQFYYCFGCGVHGNSINFLIKYNKISFIEAISYLAKETNLDTPLSLDPSSTIKNHTYSTMGKCLEIYKNNFRNSRKAKLYLKDRGIDACSIEKFDIGYSADSWNGLNIDMDKTLELSLIKSGMQIRKVDRVYDRFRNRIMFPVRNKEGNVVGFGGRSVDDSQPKYINSPETRIFHKSNELYGLYELGSSQVPLKRLLIVEGYIDVVTLHQNGIPAVAVLGTAIKVKQIKKCLKYTQELIFCFDGDSPGRRAAWKTMKVILSILGARVKIRFLFLPEGSDPDGLVRKIGRDRFEQYIENSSIFTEVFFDIIKKKFSFSSLESKIRYANTAMQYIEQVPRGFAQEIMKQELADRLNLPGQSVELACSASNTYLGKKSTSRKSTSKKSDINFSERITYLLLERLDTGFKSCGWKFLIFTDIENIHAVSSLMFCSRSKANMQNLMFSTIRKSEKASLVKIKEKIKLTGFRVTRLEFIHLFKIIKTCYAKQKIAELLMKVKEKTISPDEISVLQMILTKMQNI